jgi:hypothetical protein
MDTATEKDTRLFRFGAVVPEEHQALALRLAALEDRLNGDATLMDALKDIQHIYFIVTITDEAPQPAENTVLEENGEIFIRVSCPPVFELIKEQLLIALRQSGSFSEAFLEGFGKGIV